MPKAKVTQEQLANYLRLETDIPTMRKTLRQVETQLLAQQNTIVKMLSGGCKLELGTLTAVLEDDKLASRPPWKQIHIDHMSTEHDIPPVEVEQAARDAYPGNDFLRLVVTAK